MVTEEKRIQIEEQENKGNKEKDLNIVKITINRGAGCRACGSPFYPDCMDSCPLFDD